MNPNKQLSLTDEEEFEAKIQEFTFRSKESDFAIVKLNRLDYQESVNALGDLAGFQVGEKLHIQGRYDMHPKYGKQFRVSLAYPVTPKDLEAIREYLIHARIRGIGTRAIDLMLDEFAENIFDVIHNEPEKILALPGIGNKRLKTLQDAIQNHGDQKDTMLFLHGLKIGGALAARIWKCYQHDAIKKIKENPYQLIRDVELFGFQRADQVAQALGWSADSIHRAQASLNHLLRMHQEEGHVCLPYQVLLDAANRLIGVPHRCQEALTQSIEDGWLIWDEQVHPPSVYLPYMYRMEKEVALHIKAMLNLKYDKLHVDFSKLTSHVSRSNHDTHNQIVLADGQKEAITMASSKGLFLLTGGPGTGKTTTVQTLLALYKMNGLTVSLAAPTGRAARRLSETTHHEAHTIHRLLDFNPAERTFRRNSHQPIESDVVIIDETSMVDLWLFNSLLAAIDPKCRVVLVGDANQLPSVGAGRVYHDLLEAGVIPTICLTEIFRQAQESHIVRNAYQVLKGQPLLKNHQGSASHQGSTNHQTKSQQTDIQQNADAQADTHTDTHADMQQDDGTQTDTQQDDDTQADTQQDDDAQADAQTDAQADTQHDTDVQAKPLPSTINELRNISQTASKIDHKSISQPHSHVRDESLSDFYCIYVKSSHEASDVIEQLILERIPKRFHIATQDIQILTPMYRGVCGADMLNEKIQHYVNPQGALLQKKLPLRVGDKVMQLKNFYEKDVFNGDVGHVINKHAQGAVVDFDGRVVNYLTGQLKMLTLAYACSIHKSQGSEYPAVIIPVMDEHWNMLQRDLLYTAMTRGKQLVIIVGQARAVKKAITTVRSHHRLTHLQARLEKTW